MPGQRRIDIIKQPFAHHKGFSRTAFLAGTTVEAQSAAVAVLLQPAFGGDRRGECRGAEQIVPTAVAVGSRRQGRRFRAVGLLAESRQASNSPSRAMTGWPSPTLAIKAFGIPPASRVS